MLLNRVVENYDIAEYRLEGSYRRNKRAVL